MTSDIAELDALLGGCIEQGPITLVIGRSGTGKSTVALQFAVAAVRRGEKAAVSVFDEGRGLLLDRMGAMGFNLGTYRRAGSLHIEQLNAAELSPGELAAHVRNRVDRLQAETVVIDSLYGYQATPEENALILQIHERLQYLNRHGAMTFLTVAQHGLVGDMESTVDVTYLADMVILLRYFEAVGRVKRAISIVKKRTGEHDDTIREFCARLYWRGTSAPGDLTSTRWRSLAQPSCRRR